MSNHITIELCEADRARIDRLTDAVVARVRQVQYCLDNNLFEVSEPDDNDELNEQLKAVLAKAKPAENGTETAQGEEKPASPTEDTPPEEEKPTAAKNEPTEMTEEEAAKGRARIRSKFIELSSKGKRDDAKAIIQEYAESIPAVPADKIAECINRLSALEG